MSSPEYHALEDNTNVTINQNIVIENNSDDITISKCDQKPNNASDISSNNNGVSLKAQVLPVVYIQNNNSKIPFAFNSANKSSNNNIIFQQVSANNVNIVNKPNPSVTTIALNPKQNVVLSGRSKHLVLPKQQITIVPQGAKVTGPYVTMLKPFPKTSNEVQVTIKPENLCTQKSGESIILPKNSISLQTTVTQSPKFVLARPLSKFQQKSLLAPMPKIQSNRPPITATTNTLQAGRFTVLPVPIAPKLSTNGEPKAFTNLRITDGKVYSNATITILDEKFKKSESKNLDDDNIIEIIENAHKNDKEDVSAENNKIYELSITEEELFSNQGENKLSTSTSSSSIDSNSSAENSSLNKVPPKFSHGVSILKKNFINNPFQDNKNPDKINITKCNTEHDITIVKPSNGMEEKIVVTIPSTTLNKKPEREKSRRKSQFSLRKDFDDMEISFLDDTKAELPILEPLKKEIKEEKEEKPIVIDLKSEDNMNVTQEPVQTPIVDPKSILDVKNLEFDAAKFLAWEENIGSLPGSNLKFVLNEFGIIEYLEEDDYQKIMDKKQRKAKVKEDMEREVQCVECGCYGIRADFVNTNFCSFDCQEAGKDTPVKKPIEPCTVVNKGVKRKLTKHKSDSDIKDSNNEVSAEDETSNDTYQEKYSYPWACKKKGFSWSKYLLHINAKSAPVKLFKDPFPYTRNGFKVGMKLEGVDPQHASYFCVLTIKDVVGYRIRLHFDGYSENYDFWVNADSPDIFPMGWCEKNGHVLRPPPKYTEDNFNWLQYLKVTKSTAAPKHLFINRGQAICPNGFRIGMKLEAVDKKDSTLICVATVRDMMDNRILVHFDGWNDIYDYWADPTSPYIHPVGWCDQYGHDLTSPSDYPSPENFTWEKYLKDTKAVAAPVRAFKQRPTCGFKRGMRLECVDKRVPHLIRVATVDDVKEHQIRIHFDGWPDRYSYWVDDDSPDIHPVGWCQKTGHPMEPPLTPEDVYDFLECPTVGCRGQGHTNGLKFTTHSTQKFCPYAEANIDIDKILPDRLLSPDRSVEEKEPISRQLKDKKKPRIGRPPKWLKEIEATKQDKSDQPPVKKIKKRYSTRSIKSDDDNKPSLAPTPSAEEKACLFIEESSIYPAERDSWNKHSEFLQDYIISGENPLSWSNNDVIEFVSSIPGCNMNVDVFKEHGIDGESFLQLTQSDIIKILKYKVGPAVKLYSSIVLIRGQYCDKKKNFK